MILDYKKYDLFDKMLFERAIIKPPFKKANPMPNEACFLYVIEGETDYYSEIDKSTIKSKEAVLLKCGNYLAKMIGSKESNRYEAVAVHFHPEVLKKIYDKELPRFLQTTGTPPKQAMSKISNNVLIRKYIEGILFYFDNPELVNEEILILKLKEIILLLVQTKDAPIIQQILSGLFSPTIYSFKQRVDAHLYSSLTLNELAQLANLSVSSFKREFKKIYNNTPANYIKNKKLEHASELLLISDQRITDIAFDCGFNDLSHFSKSFQEKYGTSPSIYRLNQKYNSLS